MREPLTTTIRAGSVDDLVRKAVAHVRTHGRLMTPRAGRALEAYSVSYVLTNPHDRLHNLRAPVAIRYFARELLAFFRGSLNVEDGLAQASSKWRKVADEAGRVNSNYGYYIFHQVGIHFAQVPPYVLWSIDLALLTRLRYGVDVMVAACCIRR